MGVRPSGSDQSNGMSSGARVIPTQGMTAENRYSLGSYQVNFSPHRSLPKACLNAS